MNPAKSTAIEAGGGVNRDENYEVGKIYEVKLTNGIEFKGIVLAYDSVPPHVIIFQEGTMPETGKSMTTRTVNADFISKAECIGKFNDPLALNKENRFVDFSGLKEKEKLAIWKIESIGLGVTAEAQKIFDALSKTLSIQWENKVIVVLRLGDKDVRICSPYDSDYVTGGNRATRDRVKKVLKKVREELQLSE